MLNFQFTEYAKSMRFDKNPIDDIVGDMKYFASESDNRPLKDQFNEKYSHGGGWNPFVGFTMDTKTKAITYPDDPSLNPIVVAKYKDQEVYIYPFSWIAIVESNGDFEISRMD